MKGFFEKVAAFFAKLKKHSEERKSGWKLLICLGFILIAVLVGSCVQTVGWKYKVTDLRDATNTGTITLKANDKDEAADYTVKGEVVSGLLFSPKKVKEGVKYPAAVFIHGLYNNREMQEQNAIEMARRGYVTLEIDAKSHGHNGNSGSFDGLNLLGAAKYLYNLPYVDKTKIAVSGHSMGGSETSSCAAYDGIDTTRKPSGATWAVGSDECYKAGYHMGIVSCAIVQANNMNDSNFGSNLLGVASVKANADEFFFSSTVKRDVYVLQSRDSVTENNYKTLYVKKGSEYVQVAETDKYVKTRNYYKLVKAGGNANSHFYLESRQAVLFTKQAKNNAEAEKLEKWEVINGGIYADGKLVSQPDGKKVVSRSTKGEAIATRDASGKVTKSIRAIYEEKETHPMNHFSTATCENIIDFLYCTFGVSPAAKYISSTNQTWLTKEVFAIFGIFGMFGLLVCLLDLFLKTKTFKVLKAAEGEVVEGAPIKGVRGWANYLVPGVLTTIFGGWAFRNLNSGVKLNTLLRFNKLLVGNGTIDPYIYANTANIARWGIICAIFAICVSALTYMINHVINVIKYKEKAEEHDLHLFSGFRMRGFEHILKTAILGFLLAGIFYAIVFILWDWTKVDFRFWTFDFRVFNIERLGTYLAYAKWFFIYYLVVAALSQNYRTKSLPEWASIGINILANVLGVTILMAAHNARFINEGAMLYSTNSSPLWFICAYPVIPAVAMATWTSRKFYKRTGNAWLAAIVCALIMTIMSCANTSLSNNTIPTGLFNWLSV